MPGIVYLVGAGPGAPDLLTVRATRVLARADIIFHDALVHPGTLALAEHAEKVPVGKRSGRYATAQRFINKQLVDAARTHRTVVRLKGGDPMLFGRAHEELQYLKEQGITVEVVPGVTSALSAAADLEVSLTRRGTSRSVTFATPRVADGSAPSTWAAALAAADTGVVYMASGDAKLVMDELIARGVPAGRPVVVVENASLPESASYSGTLRDLPRLAAQCSGGPALLLIGDVLAAAQATLVGALLRRASQSA